MLLRLTMNAFILVKEYCRIMTTATTYLQEYINLFKSKAFSNIPKIITFVVVNRKKWDEFSAALNPNRFKRFAWQSADVNRKRAH